MQSIQSVLSKFNPVEDKYVSREFQTYGIYLAEQLGDDDRKSLYIKLAKTVPRAILDKALSFVSDANAKSKPRLFLWKMKELKTSIPSTSNPIDSAQRKQIVRSKKKIQKKEEPRNLGLF